MGDIIVTTPISEHDHAREEGEWVEKHPDDFWFRTLKNRADMKVGDRVYYVDLGKITGYGIVFRIEDGEMVDDSTGRNFNGMNQIKKELFADLGNIRAPAISRTKKLLINETIAELDVLLSTVGALRNADRTKAEDEGK